MAWNKVPVESRPVQVYFVRAERFDYQCGSYLHYHKIGYSSDLRRRVESLEETWEIDGGDGLYHWLPITATVEVSLILGQCVEMYLHTVLENFRAADLPQLDGYTEFFNLGGLSYEITPRLFDLESPGLREWVLSRDARKDAAMNPRDLLLEITDFRKEQQWPGNVWGKDYTKCAA